MLRHWSSQLDNPEITKYGEQIWRDADDKWHREDGPAVIYADGEAVWFRHGHKHRDDGPSTIFPDGSVNWCLNGNMYSFEDWLEKAAISCEQKVMLKLQYS